jgi:hypothetical protein
VGQPLQVGARGELGPSDRDVAVEGEQPGRRPGSGKFPEIVPVGLAGPVAIAGADAPVHAPAPVRGPGPAEEVFERGPLPGAERLDREVHYGTKSASSHAMTAVWP